ncbi:hypothetical protein ACRS3X_07635 [Ectopseudomonas hydrolytica]|uniref:hypothetical protein n=1 Tax=Ectopseudomonas hydrolytica TaxID=2493633 RepID=UPI003EE0A64B
MKTPSQLAPWTGDLSMKMHAHKPGSSESVSISDIINLISKEGALRSGDIILRPDAAFRVNSPSGEGNEVISSDDYPDALKCNGSRHLREDHPALADALSFLTNPDMPVDFGESTLISTGIELGSESEAVVMTVSGNLIAISSTQGNASVSSIDGGQTFQTNNIAYSTSTNDYIDDDGSIVHFGNNKLFIYETAGGVTEVELVGLASDIVAIIKKDEVYNFFCSNGEIYRSASLRTGHEYFSVLSDGLKPTSNRKCFTIFDGVILAVLVDINNSGGIYQIFDDEAYTIGWQNIIFLSIDSSDTLFFVQTESIVYSFDKTFNNANSYFTDSSKMRAIANTGLLVSTSIGTYVFEYTVSGAFKSVVFVDAPALTLDYEKDSGTVYYTNNTANLLVKSAIFASGEEFDVPYIFSNTSGFAYYIMR